MRNMGSVAFLDLKSIFLSGVIWEMKYGSITGA